MSFFSWVLNHGWSVMEKAPSVSVLPTLDTLAVDKLTVRTWSPWLKKIVILIAQHVFVLFIVHCLFFIALVSYLIINCDSFTSTICGDHYYNQSIVFNVFQNSFHELLLHTELLDVRITLVLEVVAHYCSTQFQVHDILHKLWILHIGSCSVVSDNMADSWDQWAGISMKKM